MAMNHRLTDSGNFYCLEPGGGNSWMRVSIKRLSTFDQRLWAMNRAKCSELRKSPLSKMQEVAATILRDVRGVTLKIDRQLPMESA